MATTVEIYEDNASEWRWRVSADGTILGKSSEGYNRAQYAENNLRTFPRYCRPIDIKTASEGAEIPAEKRILPLEFYKDVESKWRWRITAQNGRIVHAADQGWKTKEEAVTNVRALVVAVDEWGSS